MAFRPLTPQAPPLRRGVFTGCVRYPEPRTATKKAYRPKRFYRWRHKTENFFCRIRDWRRIATRYDKLARSFLAATMLVGVLYWIKL